MRAILFDKDGTLFDFARTWEVWAISFLQRLSPDPKQAEVLAEAVGFDLPTGRYRPDSIAIAGTPMDVAAALHPHLPHMSLEGLVAMINTEAVSAPQAEAVPLRPFLSSLRAQRFLLGVVTNDGEAPARAHLGAVGVVDLFDFIAGCDSGFGAKPQPGQLNAFMDLHALHPGDVVMVGDSTHDLIAARRAGTRAVGVLTGMADTSALSPLADAVLPDIGHLPDWLAGASGR